VTRDTAQVRPASSRAETSHTHVVRPLCSGVPSLWIVPSRIGRRNVVLFDIPATNFPSPTANQVAIDARVSAIAAYTPP
jgi:hypothetical protein